MDFLEYSDVTAEIKGCMTPGRLKMTDQNIVFKNSKTGKVDQIPSSDFSAVNFQNFAGTWGIRLFLKNGTLYRYVGFRESDKEKIAKFFKNSYKIDMLEKELSYKGWNWGTAKFEGSVLSFDVGDKTAFEIPLNYVSQCTAGKNEITMEFHQNDDAPVSLMEMRFFIPASELAGDTDPVEAFQERVMSKASVISISGDAIAIFRDLPCLTPRGRYDIKLYQSFFQLHGKTYDFKIPISTVLRLFILPHRDGRQIFFVVSLDPPIKQGQTRYHFVVFLFNQEDETSLELPFTEEELKEKFEGKLEKEVTGPTYEVLGKIMKHIVGRKLTGPGNFIGHTGTPAVGCSFKAAAGFLYPLERGFIYIHKPPLHIRFEEIASVNFARGGGNTRSFDFEIELKSGTVHTFSSIEKEEYAKLFDFITSKKLNIKNRGKSDKASYKDDFGDSDQEAAPDAYLERVKAEGQERDEDDDDDSDSTDEDFDPDAVKRRDSDVAEEFDSNPETSDSDDDEDGSDGGEKKEKKKKEKKKKSAKTVSEKPRKRKEKKEKDENKPKRASTAFMLWLNAHREQIKKDNPGIKVTEIAKKGGEMWRELKDKSEWEGKAAKEKEEYNKAMAEYKASRGGATTKSSSKSSSSTATKKKSAPSKKPVESSPSKTGQFKSKEFIEDSSSSDDEKKKKAPKKPAAKEDKKDASDKQSKEKGKRGKDSDDEKSKKKKKKDASEDEVEDEEEILSSPTASSESGDDGDSD
ncbi:FACT complex subunit Ssrp1 [Anthonomus grandis grandis]|uniref:FACT complex subunit Ssrp1 n=1 Tax=Anthonomus grandis grandis TaxID=2921223 RepID=UPI002164FD01|nr:FACT complex subunit Ssrp1 [Anthonomus grandis grandis]XP_050293829.1 FACT complex subunit Ssrp1 [Anthonomus grandis grandis]